RALYLPAQTGILELKPLFQLLYFPQRAPQPIFGLAPQRDVPEHHHGSHELATVVDRGARVLYGEAAAILAPEHLVDDVSHHAVVECRVDRAVVTRVVVSVFARMVHHGVHGLPQQLVDRVPRHARGRGVDEGAATVQIEAVDAFTGRIQDQPGVCAPQRGVASSFRRAPGDRARVGVCHVETGREAAGSLAHFDGLRRLL